MNASWLPDGLYWASAGAAGGYLGLFLLCRRPCALRLGRLGWLSMAVVVLRFGLVLMGYPHLGGAMPIDSVALGMGVVLLGLGMVTMDSYVWLLRAKAADLSEQIRAACAGLFLDCEESRPGLFLLRAKGETRRLQMVCLGPRMLILFLPHQGRLGKVRLLVQWLFKQYAGPIPRVTIVLRKE